MENKRIARGEQKKGERRARGERTARGEQGKSQSQGGSKRKARGSKTSKRRKKELKASKWRGGDGEQDASKLRARI
jgi:hypothetical protein